MKRLGFTLIEMVISIVILAILSTGTFVAIKELYVRTAKSKALSELSLESQIIVDQIASLLYYRVPASVIGYDGNETFESIYNLTQTFDVLEWLAVSNEAHKERLYSGFVDMDESNALSLTLVSPKTDMEDVASRVASKFDYTAADIYTDDIISLTFAGTFDAGALVFSDDFNSTFGWHGNNFEAMQDISSVNDGNITLLANPRDIYEKYYLVDTAYAVARGGDVDLSATCISDLDLSVQNDTLFFFYDYRPWKGETYCADRGSSGTKSGRVSILSNEVTGFEAGLLNNNIYFNLTMKRGVPKRSTQNMITVSKQKVVF